MSLDFTSYNGKGPDGWTLLASVDESEPYEIDQTQIFLMEDGRYVLATASGCSCWDGDWSAEPFDTLTALFASIGVTGDERRYNPSVLGVEDLRAQVLAYASRQEG